MERFFKLMNALQEKYRKFNLLKFEQLVELKEKKYIVLIEEMKSIALLLEKEYSVEMFDFSSNDKFIYTLKKFMNNRE